MGLLINFQYSVFGHQFLSVSITFYQFLVNN